MADGGFAVEAGVAGRVLVAHCGGGDGVDAVMALLVLFVMLGTDLVIVSKGRGEGG